MFLKKDKKKKNVDEKNSRLPNICARPVIISLNSLFCSTGQMLNILGSTVPYWMIIDKNDIENWNPKSLLILAVLLSQL